MLTKKTFSTLTGSCVLAAAAALHVPAASAIPINITSINGVWTAAAPAGVDGVGTSTIEWGVAATEQGRSSYVFNPFATPINGIFPEQLFPLAFFTHNNFPITAPLLSTAELTVDVGFDVIDGGMIVDSRTISSVFDFTHLESNNNSNPCADGNPNGTPPNQNGCADRVTFEPSVNTEFFTVGDIEYFFDLTGFVDIGQNFVEDFWTVENESNSAVLIAEYRVRETPVPGVAWLFAAGLALVGAARRRAVSTQ